MNPGAVEEVGKAASSFFITMKEYPLALALVIMNFALLGYIFWTGHDAMEQVYEHNAKTQSLLAKCVQIEHLKELQK